MTEIEQAMVSLQLLVQYRCSEAYTGRGRHDPLCACDYVEEVKIVVDHIEALNAKLAKAISALNEALYFLDPDEEDIAKKAGLYRIVTTYKELKELKET